MVLLNLLMALLINAVPAYGIARLGWSVPTVLVLYWLENLSVALLTILRIVMHRRWTRKRGHWRGQADIKFMVDGKPTTPKTFLSGYAGFAVTFTLAHGVFVFAICAILAQEYPDEAQWHVSAAQLQQGGLWMIAFLVVDLLVDLPRLRNGSFAWLKQSVERRMSRVLILHLAIIFGMWVMFATESPFSVVYMLIGLKTLADVASSLSSEKPLSDKPPDGVLKAADNMKAGKDVDSAALAKRWRDKLASEQRQALEDEQVMPE
ncbi:MAG TPA: DUF6498-containing protein [Luteimonas sp.]|nr:DUF6498-containing protein [Luteimonas sp.]